MPSRTLNASVLLALIALVGCETSFGDDDAAQGATGGTAGTSSGTGGDGAVGATGGTSGTGGSGSAGAPAMSSGGSAGSATSGTGGSSGGSAADGAASGSGGSATAGMSGTSPAAGSGSGGSAGATPTNGCGATDVPPGQKNSLMIAGTTVPREFIVGVPDGYDPNHPYRVVFGFHGLTGTAEQIAGNGFSGGYYGLESRIGADTIFVAPQGLAPDDMPDQYGWPNTDGRDIAFIRAMVTWLGESYCVDQTRIFSVGFSYGGIISDTIGCEMSDVFRGIAPIAGATFGRAACDGPPLAVWMAHGTADDQVAFTDGEAARDKFIAKNHCDTTQEPVAVEPEGCLSYQGCDTGAPVVWCVHDGGHMVPSYAGQAISDFFSQF